MPHVLRFILGKDPVTQTLPQERAVEFSEFGPKPPMDVHLVLSVKMVHGIQGHLSNSGAFSQCIVQFNESVCFFRSEQPAKRAVGLKFARDEMRRILHSDVSAAS